ncbi:MAG: ABC transporter permease [Nitrospirota bacterium]
MKRFSGKALSERLYKSFLAWSLFIGLWEWSIYTGILKSMLLAPPTVIIEKMLYFLEKGYLQINIAASLGRFFAGFVIAILIAIPLGLILGLFKRLYEWISPLLNFIRLIPPPAILPFAIILLGIGESPAVFVIALGSFFPILMNTVQGVKETETIHLEVVKTMGGNRVDLIRHVIFPSAIPTVMTGIRIGFGIGWLVLVSSEVVAADSGLGFMLEGARNLLETPTIFVGMTTICILGLMIDVFLKRIERFFILRKGGGYLTYN